VRITILGCSGSFPGPDSPASSYLVEAGGFRLLTDLGNGALGALQRVGGLDDVDAIWLSHSHADHCIDMLGYLIARLFHPDAPLRRLPVYAPAGMADRLTAAAAGDGSLSFASAFDFITLRPGTFEIGPMRVTAGLMTHPVETYGFRLEHEGAVLAYSADTGPCDELPALAAGADLLLCEASFLDAPDLPPDLHLTARQAGEHAARAQAAELALTHIMPWFPAGRSLEQAAASGFSGTLSVAAAGQQRVIGAG
jgi:ribonuclease BN (tRNA processing enzyme)